MTRSPTSTPVTPLSHGDRLSSSQGCDQRENLERVRDRIAALVLEFCDSHGEFRMQELTEYVSARVSVAPDSPGRILRDLKRAGRVDYALISRSKSFYQIVPPARRLPVVVNGDGQLSFA